MTTADEPGAAPVSPVAQASGTWREELLELGGPNTLLWPARDPGILDLTRAHPGGVAMLLAGREVRLGDLVREPDALHRLQRQAVRLAAHAEEIAQEHGVLTCFLTMGAATWEIPGQDERPVAPVLLRRATLRPLPGSTDHALDLAERVQLNPVLLTYLRRALRRDVDAEALVALGRAEGNGFNPTPVYEALARECVGLPALRVEPRLLVATHPFGKAESLADLTAMTAAESPPAGLVALAGGPAPAPRDHPPATTARHAVLDLPLADQRALDRATSGEDLYVDAPPGTDPARFVAAVVAEAARTGQQVLVLAEKPAVLDAVRTELGRVGLAGLVEHVVDPAAPVDPAIITARWPAEIEAKGTKRPEHDPSPKETVGRVAAHVRAVHRPREPWGVSAADAHDAIVALAAQRPAPRSRARLSDEVLRGMDGPAREDLAARVTALAEAQAWRPDTSHEPWLGAHLETEADVEDVLAAVERLRGGTLDALRREVREVFADVAEPRAGTPADHGRFLAEIEQVRDTLEVFRPEVFDSPLDGLLEATAEAGGGMGMIERRRLKAQARALLRPGRPPADLHAALAEAAEQRKAWSRLTGGGGRPRIPTDIDRAHRAYERVYADLTHVGAVLADTADGGELLTLPWAALEQRLARLARDADGARIVPEVTPELRALRDEGFGPLVDDLVARRVPTAQVADEARYVWWISLRDHIAAADADYGQAHGPDLDAALDAFAGSDRALVERNAAQLAVRQRGRFRELALSRRDLARDVADVEAGLVAGPTWSEAFGRWGGLLRAAAPAWAMSPSVVGQVLAVNDRVDLVVVADAGRTTVARSAAGIARGHRLLVVGDLGSLPPTTWTADAAVAAPAPPTESLATAAARALPTVTLPRLVGGRPEVVLEGVEAATPAPSPVRTSRPRLVTVDGRAPIDERTGLVATTPEEVAATVDKVRALVLAGARSVGVVAFSDEHAHAVSGALAEAARGDAELTDGLGRLDEPLLLRPAHRWAGEERDHVVVTVGHGRTPQGRVIDRLGAISGETGAALVRLAATRARHGATWVTTFAAADLAGERTDGPGPRALRRVVAQLEGDDPEDVLDDGPVPTSTLVADLVARLRADGFVVRTGTDPRQHPVSFVVASPGDPSLGALAVDIDGPVADDLAAAREHDRRRREELEDLGWVYLRLWSTEIYADPTRQVARIARTLHGGPTPDTEG